MNRRISTLLCWTWLISGLTIMTWKLGSTPTIADETTVTAQTSSRPVSQPQSATAPNLETLLDASVLAARDEIREEVIRSHIRFLADDLLEGRGPGTPSDAIARLYISAELERLGFQPAGENRTWEQKVPMVGVTTTYPAKTVFQNPQSGQKLELAHFEDFIGNIGSRETAIAFEDAEVVFVGYGIQAPEYDWDDFKGVDLRGKVLLMMNNDPEDDPDLFEGKRRLYYGRWSYKYESAARQGAIGAIIIHTTPSAGYPFSVIQTSWTGEEFELDQPSESSMKLKSWVSESAAKRLTQLGGFDLDALRQSAESRDFSPVPLGTTLSIGLTANVRKNETANVLGLLPGSDPQLSNQYVILMAHHDHLGVAETRDERGDTIYNGAIDNASGTATVLALAKAISKIDPPLRRSILVVAVGAEEQGLLGSAFFASNPTVDLKQVACVINVDGLNFLGPTHDVHVIGHGKSSLDRLIENGAKHQGRFVTPDLFPDRGSYYRSDQFSLAKVGVPGVYIQAGTAVRGKPEGWGKEQLDDWIANHYHQRSDEYDPNWDLSGAVEDTQLLFYITLQAANAESLQHWTEGDEFASIQPNRQPK